jgi:Flp pilus assembly pilin Flp
MMEARMRRRELGARLRALWADEAGPTAVEYAILAGGIAAVIVAAVGLFGGAVLALFQKVVTAYPS